MLTSLHNPLHPVSCSTSHHLCKALLVLMSASCYWCVTDAMKPRLSLVFMTGWPTCTRAYSTCDNSLNCTVQTYGTGASRLYCESDLEWCAGTLPAVAFMSMETDPGPTINPLHIGWVISVVLLFRKKKSMFINGPYRPSSPAHIKQPHDLTLPSRGYPPAAQSCLVGLLNTILVAATVLHIQR